MPMELGAGWDTVATLVDGRWVERRPRRDEVVAQLRRETRMMPWLAAALPLPVPVPEIASEDPFVVRHILVTGEPIEAPNAADGAAFASFLLALHGVSPAEALRHGLPDPELTRAERAEAIASFRGEVLPLLPASERAAATALLDGFAGMPADTVVHGDLGPDHLLVEGGRLSGVIDFGDAHLGDAAMDLAWGLSEAPPEFADALARSYGVTAELRRRALVWSRLGPWYEALYGMDTGQPELVDSGVDGILARLR